MLASGAVEAAGFALEVGNALAEGSFIRPNGMAKCETPTAQPSSRARANRDLREREPIVAQAFAAADRSRLRRLHRQAGKPVTAAENGPVAKWRPGRCYAFASSSSFFRASVTFAAISEGASWYTWNFILYVPRPCVIEWSVVA